MMMPPVLRKVVLTTHVATSVGWFGAVLAYIALDVTAMAASDQQTMRVAWLARDWIIWKVIVPLALASVIIGIVNALGTQWGLFRHYWVLVKLVLTLVATGVLLTEAQRVTFSATVAAQGGQVRPGSLVHSVGGVLVLAVTLILSVFKPKGVTRYGWNKQRQRIAVRDAVSGYLGRVPNAS